MGRHLQRDLDRLKKEILDIGTLVEQAIRGAGSALVDRNVDIARGIVASDCIIDEREVSLEENCLKVLALHQPVAGDLRFVVAILKVNNDLERMGDLACNIAHRSLALSSEPPLAETGGFATMVDRVQSMVTKSLDGLVNLDSNLARDVCGADDEIDDLHRDNYLALQNAMREDPQKVDRAVHALSASRYLERIADLATNIAEDVVFLVDGEIIRHQAES